MNQNQIKAAVKKYAEVKSEDLAETLKADGFKAEDADQIIKAIESKPAAKAPAAKEEEHNPNADLSLDEFDYKNLNGESFKKYEDLVESLGWNTQHDFQCFRVTPIRKERYPGLKDTPLDIVGIKLVSDAHIHTTRIAAKDAKNLNSQLPNGNDITPCHYYLLKK